MTRSDILAMKPGAELDALIAERIFDLRVFRYPDYYRTGSWKKLTRLPAYSTTWQAADKIVEKMLSDRYEFMLYSNSMAGNGFHAEFGTFENRGVGIAEAETAPDAICKAALLAKLDSWSK